MSGKHIKRVGIDAHMLGDHSGGNETYYKNILENMVPTDDLEIYVFVKKCADVSKLNKKFKIVYFGEHGASYRNLIELPMLCVKYKLDLLHVQYFIPFIRPCKVVVTIHDICFEHYKDIFTKREYIRQKLLIPYAAKKSVKIITDSFFSKNDIASEYKLQDEKIIVTHCAAGKEFRELPDENIDRERLRTEFGIEGDYILTVCNLQPRKNLGRLIKAFSLLKEEYNDSIQLVIVGKKAWMYESIFEAVPKSIKNDIVFSGYVSSDELVQLYNAAKCFVYPSFFEGFGLPVLEAMACGTPVIVSNKTSLPEVVGNNGKYFDPLSEVDIKNSLIECLTEAECKAIEKENKSKWVASFNWRNSAEILTSAYLSILDN